MAKGFSRQAGGQGGRRAGGRGGQGCLTPLLQGLLLLQLLNKALPGLTVRQVLGHACAVQQGTWVVPGRLVCGGR